MKEKLAINRQSISFLLTVILLVIIVAGLYPKNRFHQNDLILNKSNNSLRFEGNGIAYVDNIRNNGSNSRIDNFTIDLIFIPENIKKTGFKPLVTFHNGNDQKQLAVWQWGDSIIVMNGDDYDYSRKSPRLTARNILTPNKISRIIVTSNADSTRLFHNGNLLGKQENCQLQLPDNRKRFYMTVGNSVYGNHGWKGDIINLAFYKKALKVQEMSDNPQVTTKNSNGLVLLFNFTDNSKRTKDLSQNQQQLIIPSRLAALEKRFLSLPSSRFIPSWLFLADALLNIAGFIPLGATLYIWLLHLQSLPKKCAIASTIVLCFLLSLGIETIQVWLPNRNSDLLDLILNTFGAYLGVDLIVRFFSQFFILED
jgi:glycopeptide antibiotics resistance protein